MILIGVKMADLEFFRDRLTRILYWNPQLVLYFEYSLFLLVVDLSPSSLTLVSSSFAIASLSQSRINRCRVDILVLLAYVYEDNPSSLSVMSSVSVSIGD